MELVSLRKLASHFSQYLVFDREASSTLAVKERKRRRSAVDSRWW
jgi:hypothetical protein